MISAIIYERTSCSLNLFVHKRDKKSVKPFSSFIQRKICVVVEQKEKISLLLHFYLVINCFLMLTQNESEFQLHFLTLSADKKNNLSFILYSEQSNERQDFFVQFFSSSIIFKNFLIIITTFVGFFSVIYSILWTCWQNMDEYLSLLIKDVLFCGLLLVEKEDFIVNNFEKTSPHSNPEPSLLSQKEIYCISRCKLNFDVVSLKTKCSMKKLQNTPTWLQLDVCKNKPSFGTLFCKHWNSDITFFPGRT